MSDFIPRSAERFKDFAKNLVTYSLANFSRWQVPTPQTTLGQPLADFEAAFAAYLDPNHGKIDTVRKQETRELLEKAIRVYVAAYLAHNPLVTDEDKVALQIPIYKKSRKPVATPTTSPQLECDTNTRRHILVYYRDEGAARRGKPAGVRGIEVRWAMLDAPPKDISELVHSEYDTRPPIDIEFGEGDRGRKVFMCGRWGIEREGIKGPWGDIEEVIVP